MANGFLTAFYRPVDVSGKKVSDDEGGIKGGTKGIVLSGDLMQFPNRC